MKTMLFIPALMAGEIDVFMQKIAIVVLLWLVVIFASMIDLITGIAASRRTGNRKTTSWGLRRTLSKDLQYLAMLVMLLVIDVCLSSLSPYLSFFSVPLLSFIGATAIAVIEGLSVIENTRKGKNAEDDKVDDIEELLKGTVETLGSAKTKEFLSALQKYVNKDKKS